METPRFVENRQIQNRTYEVYQANSAESARSFLKSKQVNKKLYYIMVETPEGDWGVDIDGLYLEQLVPFQLDINSADCEGSICGTPTPTSLQYAANEVADNFVVTVKCGKCSNKWEDGICYKNMTVVRCPHCNSLNKVDSRLDDSRHAPTTLKCQFCGKQVLEKKGVIFTNLENAVEVAQQMMSRQCVCSNCSSVFCLECGNAEGYKKGTGSTHCPNCGTQIALEQLL